MKDKWVHITFPMGTSMMITRDDALSLALKILVGLGPQLLGRLK